MSRTRVLILTTFEADEHVFETLRGGAGGFLLKDVEPAELLHAIRIVAGGEALLSPSVTQRRQILVEVASGRSNDEIAAALVLSPATVKTHVSRVMSKLDAHDRAQLVVIAYESALVTPGSRA